MSCHSGAGRLLQGDKNGKHAAAAVERTQGLPDDGAERQALILGLHRVTRNGRSGEQVADLDRNSGGVYFAKNLAQQSKGTTVSQVLLAVKHHGGLENSSARDNAGNALVVGVAAGGKLAAVGDDHHCAGLSRCKVDDAEVFGAVSIGEQNVSRNRDAPVKKAGQATAIIVPADTGSNVRVTLAMDAMPVAFTLDTASLAAIGRKGLQTVNGRPMGGVGLAMNPLALVAHAVDAVAVILRHTGYTAGGTTRGHAMHAVLVLTAAKDALAVKRFTSAASAELRLKSTITAINAMHAMAEIAGPANALAA